jgi:hypothetical protein
MIRSRNAPNPPAFDVQAEIAALKSQAQACLTTAGDHHRRLRELEARARDVAADMLALQMRPQAVEAKPRSFWQWLLGTRAP